MKSGPFEKKMAQAPADRVRLLISSVTHDCGGDDTSVITMRGRALGADCASLRGIVSTPTRVTRPRLANAYLRAT